MNIVRRLVLSAALCGLCCGLADGQDASRQATLPQRANNGTPQLARLPLVRPIMASGFGAFSGWHRSDIKLAPDHLDATDWGSGSPSSLPPWRLLPKATNGLTFTGLLNVGATANPENPASRFNGPQTFNDREDLQLNQFLLSVQRKPNARHRRFDLGCRVDLLFGTDYIFVQADGWELQPDGDNALNGLTTGNGNPDLLGLAVPQAYVDLACDRFNFRIGHFYSIAGYEGVEPSTNFFFSHTYATQYGQPLTHTGGLLSWMGQRTTLQAGVVNGWDAVDRVNDEASLLGGIRWADGPSSLGISLITGNEDGLTGRGRRTAYSVVWQSLINERLAYVLQHDLGYQVDSLATGLDARWYGISQYLYFALSESWKLGARFEWFRDDQGTRLAAMPIRNGGLGLPAGGFAGTYYSATLGANWTPSANLTLRPEIRWDWSEHTMLAPFGDFTSDSQLTLAVDAVFLF